MEMRNLQFITHQNERYSYLDSVEIALKSGIRWVQLRMKDASSEELEQTAIKAKSLCEKYDSIFFIDDNVELASKLKVHGVHLGQDDMPIDKAKQIAPNLIIGGTANTIEDIKRLSNLGADYIGLGPFKYTETKKRLKPTLGISGYRNIIEECEKEQINIPIFAIGGIEEEDISDLFSIPVHGIAISSLILNSENPVQTGQRIVEIINNIKL